MTRPLPVHVMARLTAVINADLRRTTYSAMAQRIHARLLAELPTSLEIASALDAARQPGGAS